jgi:hypothetical protein
MKTLASVCISVALCVPGGFAEEEVPEAAQHLASPVREMLKEFEAKGDADYLLIAIAGADKLQATNADERIQICLELLQKLSKYYDANCDLALPPAIELHVKAPAGYDSGVSPEQVTDLAQRADYERRIAENRRRAQQYKAQTAIRKLMAKTVSLCLNEEHGVIEKVELRLQRAAIPESVKNAMKTLARQGDKSKHDGL